MDAGCRIAIVNSDYASSRVSVIRDDGSLCSDGLIHSGSRPPGLVTALSGDVVVPRSTHPAGLVTVIDRQHAVLSFVDPATSEVLQQLSLGADGPVNPHDVVFVGPNQGYISLLAGGGLLRFDPATGQRVAEVDLRSQATALDGAALHPQPDQMALIGGRLWVGLLNLTPSFQRGGPGVVVAVDTQSDQVVERFELPRLKNCGTALAPEPGGGGFWLSCSGVFASASQRDDSGLAYIDAGDSPEVLWVGEASALTQRPVGFALAPRDAVTAFVVAFGSVTDGVADALLLVDRSDGSARDLGVSTGAFQLGGLLLSDDGRRLLMADGDPAAPRLRRFDVAADGSLVELDPVDVNPVAGLPPRTLGPFR